MVDEHSAPVLERADQEILSRALDSSRFPAATDGTGAKLAIVPPHILSTVSSTTGQSSLVSSRTVSLGSGASPSSSVTPVTPASTAGSAVAVVLIVIIILSIISCVAGCIWRCCVRKGRKERATKANQQESQEHSQSQPQNSQYRSDLPEEQLYERSQNEIPMHNTNISSTSRPSRSNTARRFETIPEHDDQQEGYVVEHNNPFDGPEPQNSNVSPRKGYFYHQDTAHEYS